MESTLMVPPATKPLQQAELAMSQKSDFPQLESSLQVVKQAVGPQTYGVQGVAGGWAQFPIPSQAGRFVMELSVQLAVPEPQAVSFAG
jgi:hypothetical protein